jgi:hypothetical protein
MLEKLPNGTCRKSQSFKKKRDIEWRTYKNISPPPAARIRRVVLDQPIKTAVLICSQASSIVISDAEEAIFAIIVAL